MWSFEDLPGSKIDLCQSVDFIPLLTNAGKTDEIDKLFSKKWKKVANKINLEESGARRAIISRSFGRRFGGRFRRRPTNFVNIGCRLRCGV
jgi:hypothetical protein